MSRLKTQQGFTLIELIMYIALFSILIGGVLMSMYSIIESSGHNQTQTELLEEGNFLLDKISWVMNDAETVNSPNKNGTDVTLSVTTWDTSVSQPVVVRITAQNMTIQIGTSSTQQLNNTHVWISNALFTHTYATGAGTIPESVTVVFTLNTRTPEGGIVSHVFSSAYYVKK